MDESQQLEFPISLDAVLSVSINFDQLKVILEFLLMHLREHDLKLREKKPVQSDPQAVSEPLDLAFIDVLKRRIKKRKGETLSESQRNDKQDKLLQELLDRMTLQEERIQGVETGLEKAGERIGINEIGIGELREVTQGHEDRIQTLERRKPEIGLETATVLPPNQSESRVSIAEKPIPVDLSPLTQRLEALEQQSSTFDSRLDVLNHQSESLESSLQNLSESVAVVDSRILSLDNSQIGLEESQQLLTQTQKAMESTENAIKETLQDIENRLSALERGHLVTDNRSLENKQSIDMLKRVTKQLEELLRNKADADALDSLRSMVAGINNKGGSPLQLPLMATKDTNLIRELDRKVTILEESISRIGNGSPKMADFAEKLDAVFKQIKEKASQEEVEGLQALLKKQRTELDRMEGLMRDMEERPVHVMAGTPPPESKFESSKISRLTHRLDALEDAVKELNVPVGPDVSKFPGEIKRLWETLEELKISLEKLRKEMLARLRDLEDLLSRKADMTLLVDLERKSHTDRCEDAIKTLADALPKRFAEKNETKKALRFMETRVHEIMETSPERKDGEDAMIARKYLGGWSCLSCEKALEKLKGRMAGYQSWNKLPKRDPTDRIARAGPGFSKMLATFQPDILSNRSRLIPSRKFSPQSQSQVYEEMMQEVFQLPPVKVQDPRPSTTIDQ